MGDEVGMWLYQINRTIQGEGLHAGTPIVLMRFMLCNLKCSLKEGGFDCDTYFTWDRDRLASGFHADVAEIVTTVNEESGRFNDKIPESSKANMIMLTGGEPLIWQNNKEFIKLLRVLKSMKFFIAVETNGTQVVRKTTKEFIDEFAISPKQSQYPQRYNEGNVSSYFDTNHFWKFVCGNLKDVENVKAFLTAHDIPKEDRIYIMPEGGDPISLQHSKDFINANNITEMLMDMGYDNIWISERLQIMGGFV